VSGTHRRSLARLVMVAMLEFEMGFEMGFETERCGDADVELEMEVVR